MSKGNREVVADWMVAFGGVLLFASLFLTWSHQLSHAFLVLFGNLDAVRSIPRDPTAWQVYESADVVLAVFAFLLLGVALAGSRPARMAAFAGCFATIVFVVHAIVSPPTDRLQGIFNAGNSVPQYYPVVPDAGLGETVALLGVLLAAVGLAISFTADEPRVSASGPGPADEGHVTASGSGPADAPL